MRYEYMKKTYRELKELDTFMATLYKRDKTVENSKFGYAYGKFARKNLVPLMNELGLEYETLWVENALTDPNTKQVLLDPMSQRKYKFGKEGLLAVLKGEKEISEKWDNKEAVEVEPYICSEVPLGLVEEEKEMLRGLIIN